MFTMPNTDDNALGLWALATHLATVDKVVDGIKMTSEQALQRTLVFYRALLSMQQDPWNTDVSDLMGKAKKDLT